MPDLPEWGQCPSDLSLDLTVSAWRMDIWTRRTLLPEMTAGREEMNLPLPEPHFSSSLSHNGISQESALRLVETLPSCPRVREASVK